MSRVVLLLYCIAAICLVGVPINAQSEPPAPVPATAPAPTAVDNAQVLYYDVNRNLSLHCDLPKDSVAQIVWHKNGSLVDSWSDLKTRVELQAGGAILSLGSRAREDDFGNYSCSAGGTTLSWDVRARPHLKLPPNANVVEGQELKLQCRVLGKPYPERVVWRFSNGSHDAELGTGSGAETRPSEQGVLDAALVLTAARRSDAGRYTCLVVDADVVNATSTVRVKDMYAALWPFLGICAEVFVLCAIILVYEKRRTKPDLDDSDTDNHDHKKS